MRWGIEQSVTTAKCYSRYGELSMCDVMRVLCVVKAWIVTEIKEMKSRAYIQGSLRQVVNECQ